jgi:hypothetical protein
MKAAAAPRSWRDELDLVRWPAAALALVLLAGAALAITAGSMRRQQDATLDNARKVHQAAKSRFHNVEVEKQEIAVYQPRFLALRSAGLVGPENRLAWIEAIKQSQASRGLPTVAYEIEPQQVLTMDTPLALGDYTLHGSRMKVQLGLLHEGDMFAFLDDLRRAGRFSIQDCRIKRNNVPAELPLAPRLQAECSLVWLSLSAKGAA